MEASVDQEFDARWLGAVIEAKSWHFHRRLLERYGIVLGPADYSGIVNAIARGKAPLIDVNEDESAVYLVQVPSTNALFFAAAKPNGDLITAMPTSPRLLSLAHFLRK